MSRLYAISCDSHRIKHTCVNKLKMLEFSFVWNPATKRPKCTVTRWRPGYVAQMFILNCFFHLELKKKQERWNRLFKVSTSMTHSTWAPTCIRYAIQLHWLILSGDFVQVFPVYAFLRLLPAFRLSGGMSDVCSAAEDESLPHCAWRMPRGHSSRIKQCTGDRGRDEDGGKIMCVCKLLTMELNVLFKWN